MESRALATVSSRVEFASGYLLQVRNGALLAQKFDPGSRKLIGEPFQIAQNVEASGSGSARFSASEEGTLVFRASASGGGEQLVWMNRRGERLETVGAPGQYMEPALSPDGTQLAVVVSSEGGASDIWIYDLERNLGSRFTFAHRSVFGPTWSPDGSRLAFWDDADSSRGIYAKQVGGGGSETLLMRTAATGETDYWSSDGRWLTYIERGGTTGWDIHGLSFDRDSVRSVPVRVTPFNEYQSSISPDGSLLAYGSTESGGYEVFVQAFPGPGGKWRISTSGGGEPHWRGDGRELYYLSPDRKIMAVTVTPGTPPHFSLPHELFQTAASTNGLVRNRYDVSRDGQRFLVVSSGTEGKVGPTTVVLDWLGRLEKR
jgi:Tol biopolymer transport system component